MKEITKVIWIAITIISFLTLAVSILIGTNIFMIRISAPVFILGLITSRTLHNDE